MKVAHLTTVASSHRYLLLPQLMALRDAGHDVVAVSAPGSDTDVLASHGIRHRSLDGSTRGFDLRADFLAAKSLISILRDERPDLLHTHNPKPGVYGRILGRLLRVPHIVNTVHGLYAAADDPLARRAVVYSLEAIATRCSDLELMQNVEDMDLFVETPLAPSRRVRFLGNGIDIDRFAPLTDRQRVEFRRDLGIDGDAVMVVSVGRLVAEKGFPELFAASAMVERPHQLVVVGPDDPEKADALAPQQRQQAEERGVRFLGHREDIDRILGAADLFVLASHREGFPRAAMEAAATGLPVIATDIRGCRQVVDHDRTGMLVPRNEAPALAAAIETLVGDASRRRRYGAAARAKAVAEFDERDVIARLLAAYAELYSDDRTVAVSTGSHGGRR